jgi:hypothetical protein
MRAITSTLALLLRSDLRSARDRQFEDRLELGPSDDFAADVADDPTEPAAQQAMVALELLGMGIARSHHRRALGDVQIRLPEPDLASRRARPGSKLQVMGLHPLRRSRRFSGRGSAVLAGRLRRLVEVTNDVQHPRLFL